MSQRICLVILTVNARPKNALPVSIIAVTGRNAKKVITTPVPETIVTTTKKILMTSINLNTMNWIDCRERMPEETRQMSDNLQGHHKWSESERVLAWDSLYGPQIDWTRNGRWHSEFMGEYCGQVYHSVVAWMPIPEMDIEDYKL